MTPEDEDDAFTFPGDDEPAFREATRAVPRSAATSRISGAGSDTEATEGHPARSEAAATASAASDVGDTVDDAAVAPRGLPAAVLIFYGFVSGWMVLYTIGWSVIAAQSWSVSADAPLLDILSNLMLVLMGASPLIWLVTAIVLTRGKRLFWTALWLLIGVIVLMPWPYFIAQQAGVL